MKQSRTPQASTQADILEQQLRDLALVIYARPTYLYAPHVLVKDVEPRHIAAVVSQKIKDFETAGVIAAGFKIGVGDVEMDRVRGMHYGEFEAGIKLSPN